MTTENLKSEEGRERREQRLAFCVQVAPSRGSDMLEEHGINVAGFYFIRCSSENNLSLAHLPHFRTIKPTDRHCALALLSRFVRDGGKPTRASVPGQGPAVIPCCNFGSNSAGYRLQACTVTPCRVESLSMINLSNFIQGSKIELDYV